MLQNIKEAACTNASIFPVCTYYEVRGIEWRTDRFAIYEESGCVVSGLTFEQTFALMTHFKILEGK